MPVGVPDFWPGQLIHYENVPTDGRLDASPTSNWAFDHKSLPQHATFATSPVDVLMYSRPIYTVMLNRDVMDKLLADWICDGDWHDWALPFGTAPDSGYNVMQGALIRVWGISTPGLGTLELKGNGSVGAANVAMFHTSAADTAVYQEFTVGLNGDGIVRYKTYASMWSLLSAMMAGFWR